jgi:hypothetical protein
MSGSISGLRSICLLSFYQLATDAGETYGLVPTTVLYAATAYFLNYLISNCQKVHFILNYNSYFSAFAVYLPLRLGFFFSLRKDRGVGLQVLSLFGNENIASDARNNSADTITSPEGTHTHTHQYRSATPTGGWNALIFQ